MLVEVPHAIDNPLNEAIGLEIDVMRGLGERKVDVLLVYPGSVEQPIHRIARKTGLRL